MPAMDEAVSEFLIESHENLDQLDRDLVSLEADPSSRETLARVFRTIHTIKGTCGFLGFSKLERVTHAGEGLLSRLRDGELIFHREIADGLLALVDAVRRMLAEIERTRGDGDEDHSAIVARLVSLQERAAPVAAPAGGGLLAAARPAGVAESSIRVDVSLLDRLMTLVGELVLTRNQILQITGARREPALLSASQRLNLITTELQEGVMKTRMQPLAGLVSRLPRQVRDLASSCGRKVRLELEGMDTELDRSLIEAFRDPLTHIVRNAIDHGIETPEARTAAGKPAEGRISVRAHHEGGLVHIEIGDDGAGIDPARIREEAVRRGMVEAEAARRLGEREVLNLIFLPGFSTARNVTSVSGRGVGMDVVRTNIERIGGAVEIRSALGKGTTIGITLPLTLAIIPTLIVTCGGHRYAIPQTSLLELVLLQGREAQRGIETIHGASVYRLRGSLLPLVHLGREMERGARPQRPRPEPAGDLLGIIVLRAEGRSFGLVVEGIEDTEEIVVRPLGRHLKRIPIFAGATVLGDGGVALILDVTGLAQRARVIGGTQARRPADAAAPKQEIPAEAPAEIRTLLLFDVRGNRRMAVPLSAVARLEEFPHSAIERLGAREVVQYRSEILPLLRISRLFGDGGGEGAGTAPLQVVVYSDGERSAGLIVDRIHDIVQEPLRMSRRGGEEGVAGSAIIQRRITEILDLPGILRSHDLALEKTEALLPVRA